MWSTLLAILLSLGFADDSQVCTTDVDPSCGSQVANGKANILTDAQVETMDDGVTTNMKFQLLQTGTAQATQDPSKEHEHYVARDALAEEAVFKRNIESIKEKQGQRMHLVEKEINKENQRHDKVMKTISHMEENIDYRHPHTVADGAEAKERARHTAQLHTFAESANSTKAAYEDEIREEIRRHDKVSKHIAERVSSLLAMGEVKTPTKEHDHYVARDALAETDIFKRNVEKITESKDKRMHMVEQEINKENQRHESIVHTIEHMKEDVPMKDPVTPKKKAEAKEHERHAQQMHTFADAVASTKADYETAMEAEIRRHDGISKFVSQRVGHSLLAVEEAKNSTNLLGTNLKTGEDFAHTETERKLSAIKDKKIAKINAETEQEALFYEQNKAAILLKEEEGKLDKSASEHAKKAEDQRHEKQLHRLKESSKTAIQSFDKAMEAEALRHSKAKLHILKKTDQ